MMFAPTARIVRIMCIALLAGLSMGAGTGMAAAASAKPAKSAKPATGAPTRSAAVRRLETTHIAGEIPVPQVLFVTARDQRRFMDFHHQRYLKTSRQLADATPIPSWMTVTRNARAETSP